MLSFRKCRKRSRVDHVVFDLIVDVPLTQRSGQKAASVVSPGASLNSAPSVRTIVSSVPLRVIETQPVKPDASQESNEASQPKPKKLTTVKKQINR